MKRSAFAFFVLCLFLLLVSSLPLSYARHEKELKVERLDVADEEKTVFVRVKNSFKDADIKVTAVMPDLGVRASRSFRLEQGDRSSRQLFFEDIPESASGQYVVRVSVNGDGMRRTKHRLIII